MISGGTVARNSANEQQRPRQFSLAKLLGWVTVAALLVASWRIASPTIGIIYFAWASGTLAAILIFLALPTRIAPAGWAVFQAVLSAPIGGAVGASLGGLLAANMFPDRARTPGAMSGGDLEFWSNFGGAGSLALILFASFFGVLAHASAPQAGEKTSLSRYVFVIALTMICVIWLLIVLSSNVSDRLPA